jgi:hypothetical protein
MAVFASGMFGQHMLLWLWGVNPAAAGHLPPPSGPCLPSFPPQQHAHLLLLRGHLHLNRRLLLARLRRPVLRRPQ